MKHLRRFTESENLMYYEINSSEYYDTISETKTRTIPNHTTEKIKGIVPDDFSVSSDMTSILITNNKPYWDDGVIIRMSLDDDWWFWVIVELEAANLYYKCDDVEGFAEMIQKEFNSLIPFE